MASEAEVDLLISTAGALPELERDLSRIIRQAENDADAIDVDVALDTRESVRTLSVQLDSAVREAEGRLDGVEVGVLIEQRDALRTLDRQLTQIVDTTNRRLETTDPLLLQGLIDAPETIRNMRTQVRQIVATVQAVAPEIEINVDVDERAVRRIPDLTNSLSALGRTGRVTAQSMGLLTGGVAALSVGVGSLVPLLASTVATVQQLAPAAAVATQALLAQQLVAGTLKIAMVGVEEAIENAFDPDAKPEELQKSLERLAPEARKFVVALQGMRGELRQIQQGVQNRAFQDLDESLTSLGRVTGPVVTAALNQTATSLNNMAKGAVEAANSLSSSGILGQALDGATQGLTNLEAVPGRLTVAFTTLAAGAAPAFDRITQAIDAVTLRIQEKLLRSLNDGSLQRAIDGAVSAIGQLFTILGNFGEGFGNIFGALTQEGGGLFDILEKISEAFVKLTASEEFQRIMLALTETMGVLVEEILPLIQEAFVALAPVIEELAPAIQDLVRELGPELTEVVKELAPVLLDLAKITREQLPAAIEIAKGVLISFTGLLRLLHFVLEGAVLPAARKVSEFLHGPFVDDIREGFNLIHTDSTRLEGAFTTLFDGIGRRAFLLIANLQRFVGVMRTEFNKKIYELLNGIVDAFEDLPGQVGNALATLVGNMTGLGRDAIKGFAVGFASGIGDILGQARRLADSVTSTIAAALDSHSPSRKTQKEGQNAGDGLALGLKDSKGKVKKAAQELAGVVKDVATAEFAAPATKFFEQIQEQVGRAVGEVFDGPSVDIKDPIIKFFENMEIEVGRAVGEVLNGPSIDFKGPILEAFQELQEAVGIAVGEVINGPSVDLTKPKPLGPLPTLPTLQGEGTSVVQVFIGNQLVEQFVDNRLRQAQSSQDRRVAQGVRI